MHPQKKNIRSPKKKNKYVPENILVHSPQVREFTDGISSEALSKSRNFAYASPIRSLEIDSSSRITRTRDVCAPLSRGGGGGEEGGGEGGGGGGFFLLFFYFF